MLKDNGRFKKASKKEVGNVKVKDMVCLNCGNIESLTNVEFGSMKCSVCSGSLVDLGFEHNKTTGES
jgi:hypothetical protein